MTKINIAEIWLGYEEMLNCFIVKLFIF